MKSIGYYVLGFIVLVIIYNIYRGISISMYDKRFKEKLKMEEERKELLNSKLVPMLKKMGFRFEGFSPKESDLDSGGCIIRGAAPKWCIAWRNGNKIRYKDIPGLAAAQGIDVESINT